MDRLLTTRYPTIGASTYSGARTSNGTNSPLARASNGSYSPSARRSHNDYSYLHQDDEQAYVARGLMEPLTGGESLTRLVISKLDK